MPDAFSHTFTKAFARRLMLGISSGCIGRREYIPWADRVIAREERPPFWVCELSTSLHLQDALAKIGAYAYEEPFEQFSDEPKEYLAFLWLRYRRKEISWATFLREAGDFTDGDGGFSCEEFYSDLTELEEHAFAAGIEEKQTGCWANRLHDQIERISQFYTEIQSP